MFYWPSRFLILLLILAFATWGISDVFRAPTVPHVALVGSSVISVEEFQSAWNKRLEKLNEERSIESQDDYTKRYIATRMLDELISEAILYEEAKSIGLGVSIATADKVIASEIVDNLGEKLQLSRIRYLLKQKGWSPTRYVKALKKELTLRQLTEAAVSVATVPVIMNEMVLRYLYETRTVSFIQIKEDKVSPIDTASDEELYTFYNVNKHDFISEETRDISYILLTPESIAHNTQVSELEIKKYYEANKDAFRTPEERRAELITFDTFEEATKAHKQLIANTKTFEELAFKSGGMKSKDIDLGFMTKVEYLDQTVGDAVFSLKQLWDISKPINGIGYYLSRLVAIKPASTDNYNEVKDNIRKTLADKKAKDLILRMYGRIENYRTNGFSLEEIADFLSLDEPVTASIKRTQINISGLTDDSRSRIAEAVFSAELGVEAEPLEIQTEGDRSLLFFELKAKHIPKLHSFNEAKKEVLKEWQTEQRNKKLDALAEDVAERLEAGESIESVARSLELTVEKTNHFRYGSEKTALSKRATRAAFTVIEGGVVISNNDKGRVVMKVTASNPHLTSSLESSMTMANITRNLRTSMKSELTKQMVQALKSKYNPQINWRVVNSLIGVESRE